MTFDEKTVAYQELILRFVGSVHKLFQMMFLTT